MTITSPLFSLLSLLIFAFLQAKGEEEQEFGMGRGKIEIKRIENSSNRQVTYSKRRNGIMKKAKEITILCDARVSLVIFAASGKIQEYCSPSTNLIDLLEKYQKLSGKRLWDAKHENLSNEIDRIKKENDNMQIELRHLRGEDITSLHFKELMALEDALEHGLTNIRDKKNEVYKMKRNNGQNLEEENMHLNYVYQQQMASMGGDGGGGGGVRENENEYQHQTVREYQSELPFVFRLQPFQPNLQDRV